MVSKTGRQTNEQTLYNILPGLVFPFMVFCVIHIVSYTQDAVIQFFQDLQCHLLLIFQFQLLTAFDSYIITLPITLHSANDCLGCDDKFEPILVLF